MKKKNNAFDKAVADIAFKKTYGNEKIEPKLYQVMCEWLGCDDTFSTAFVLETFIDNLGYKNNEYLEKFKNDRVFRVVEIKKFLEETYIDLKYYKYEKDSENYLKNSSYLNLMNDDFKDINK